MRIVYLILAHHRPDLVEVLVDTLASHTSVRIYLHVDPRADLSSFPTGATVEPVMPRIRGNWGSYGLVRATLSGLRLITQRERGPYNLVLLSGQDFPVKRIGTIERFFATTPWKAHMSFARMGTPEGKDTNRYARYFLHHQFNVRGAWRIQKFLNENLRERRFPRGFEPYSGSQWWSARDDVVQHIVTTAKTHREYRRFFWFSSIPDEMFFQTIVMNSHFAGTVLNDSLRFAEWPDGSWSPRILTHEDIPRLLDSPALFARKFEHADVTREISRRLKIPARGST